MAIHASGFAGLGDYSLMRRGARLVRDIPGPGWAIQAMMSGIS
jgi:hypothetical protein